MSNPRHQANAPMQWAQATWTWSSALLLSALLVSPVGSEALLNLLRLHLPVAAQSAERNAPSASARENTAHRKVEEERVAAQHDTQATPDLEPTPTVSVALAAAAPTLPRVRRVASVPATFTSPALSLRAAIAYATIPRGPPV